jgi:hypothetical protein
VNKARARITARARAGLAVLAVRHCAYQLSRRKPGAKLGHPTLRLFRIGLVVLLAGLAWAWPAAAHAQGKADAVVVLNAQVGLFGPPATVADQFLPSTVLPLSDGQSFGWRMTIKTNKKWVRVREELTLPAEPKTWGDPEPDLKRKTSADGRTATTELLLEPVAGVIQFSWTVTTGDPRGTWVLKLRIEDQAEQVFKLQAR